MRKREISPMMQEVCCVVEFLTRPLGLGDSQQNRQIQVHATNVLSVGNIPVKS